MRGYGIQIGRISSGVAMLTVSLRRFGRNRFLRSTIFILSSLPLRRQSSRDDPDYVCFKHVYNVHQTPVYGHPDVASRRSSAWTGPSTANTNGSKKASHAVSKAIP